jgi:xRRM domain
MSYLNSQEIAQVDALDQIGSAPTGSRPRIELELVEGKREELYWDKVPEKVRSVAVARLQGLGDGPSEEHDGGRRRKRRKKG